VHVEEPIWLAGWCLMALSAQKGYITWCKN